MRNVLWERGSPLRFFSPCEEESAYAAGKLEALITREESGAADARL